MEDFAGVCGHTRPKYACIVLNIYCTIEITKKGLTTIEGFPAFWTANLDKFWI
jgi:hypothetical protein